MNRQFQNSKASEGQPSVGSNPTATAAAPGLPNRRPGAFLSYEGLRPPSGEQILGVEAGVETLTASTAAGECQ